MNKKNYLLLSVEDEVFDAIKESRNDDTMVPISTIRVELVTDDGMIEDHFAKIIEFKRSFIEHPGPRIIVHKEKIV